MLTTMGVIIVCYAYYMSRMTDVRRCQLMIERQICAVWRYTWFKLISRSFCFVFLEILSGGHQPRFKKVSCTLTFHRHKGDSSESVWVCVCLENEIIHFHTSQTPHTHITPLWLKSKALPIAMHGMLSNKNPKIPLFVLVVQIHTQTFKTWGPFALWIYFVLFAFQIKLCGVTVQCFAGTLSFIISCDIFMTNKEEIAGMSNQNELDDAEGCWTCCVMERLAFDVFCPLFIHSSRSIFFMSYDWYALIWQGTFLNFI